MIKMIAGTFGLPVNGVIKPMTKDSGPFEAAPEQETRLVKLGLAVYVGEPTTLPDGVVGIPEYSMESSAKELREIGKLCGLTFKVGMSKAEMIEALDAHIVENTVEGVEVNEDAPTFDASEAVQ